MNDIAIKVCNLGKSYRINHQQTGYRTLRESITELAASPFRKIKSGWSGNPVAENEEILWALMDVNLVINKGEILGIMGRNGAGKSTLLKILSNVTKPTTGYAEIHGRVGSLLEIGAGFHHELTGRENIYLNGAILGMRRIEIDKKLDEIIAFSEIERFIDTPVKHYSSGMYMRLAFAVAAHLDTEILLIDEVLAVGDIRFQQKCINKMNEVSKSGQTVLVVSHNMRVIETLTDRSIYFKQGQIKGIGDTKELIKEYQKDAFATHYTTQLPSKYDIEIQNPGVSIKNIILTDLTEKREVESVEPDTPLRLSFLIEAIHDVENAVFCLVICKDKLVISGNNSSYGLGRLSIEGHQPYEISVQIDELRLVPGFYSAVIFVLPNNLTGVASSLSKIHVKDFIVSGARSYGSGYAYIRQTWKMEPKRILT